MGVSTIIAGVGAAAAVGGVGIAAANALGDGSSSAASEAANAQIASANRAAELQKQEYEQTRADLGPWRDTGGKAINYLGGILNIPGMTPVDPTNALRATPGYNFAMNQGVDARERSAAARGGLLSTPEQKSLTTFGQGLADQTYQNYLNNLFNVSGSGLNAASMTGTAGMNYANQAGSDYMAAGQAQAQGVLNAYNAQQSGYNQLGSSLGGAAGYLSSPTMQNYLKTLTSPTTQTGYNYAPTPYNPTGGDLSQTYADYYGS